MTGEEQLESVPLQEKLDVTCVEGEVVKPQWSNKFQCIIALLGFSVGLGNLWRFPYVCQRNGGDVSKDVAQLLVPLSLDPEQYLQDYLITAPFPHHVGIIGDTIPDAAAKAALNKTVTPLLNPYSDYKPLIGSYIRDQMQKNWDTQLGISAFLIPHIIFTITVAVPLFFLEVALGQFSRKGPIGVWAMCPLMKGIGFSIMTLSCLIVPYYSMVFAWALYYIYSSFATVLPWTTCGNAWNTRQCVAVGALRGGVNRSTGIDGSISNLTEYLAVKEVSGEANNSSGATKAFGHTATEEFWQYKVLGISSGIDDVGTVQLHLLICWFLTCLFLFLCIMKGIRSLGKVVYVTALMPYILLTVLLIRACMMPGSLDGILYYVTPDFNRLQQSQVWLEAILQVFFSVGPAWGTIITMSSHNSPHNNIVRDSILVTLLGELTSVFSGFVVFATVGFLAHDLGQPVADVITSGPGIGFIVYPEAVSLLPFSHLWSVLFFLIVLMMGVDTTFGNIEAALACIEDVLPRRFHVKHLQTILAALFMSLVFLCGLPYTTNAGVYMFQLFDWYVAAVACFLIGTLECLVVGWCYGMKRFAADVEAMIGKRLPVIYKLMCFIVVPALLMVAMGLAVASYKPPTYGGYEYPYFAVIIGWCIALSSVVPIPVTFVMQILDERGSLAQRVESAMTPNSDWARCRRRYDVHERTNCTMKDNALFLFNQ